MPTREEDVFAIVDACLVTLKAGSNVPEHMLSALADATALDPNGDDLYNSSWGIFGRLANFVPGLHLKTLLDDFLAEKAPSEWIAQSDEEVVAQFRRSLASTLECGTGFYCREIFGSHGQSIWAAFVPCDSPLGGEPHVPTVTRSLEEIEALFRHGGWVFPASFDGTPNEADDTDWEFPFGLGDHFTDAEIVGWVYERVQSA